MENFRSLIIDIYLSSRLPNFQGVLQEGVNKRSKCSYYDGKFCNVVKTKDPVLISWEVSDRIVPHPIMCYLCPYYSSGAESKVITSLLQLLRDYVSMRNGIEREIYNLESRTTEMLYSSIVLRRRRQELISILNEVQSKIELIKLLIKYEEENHV
ncbi:MAG: hypothetical protein QXR57_04325 [Metallosphaera sp.]|uniref:hypothetical protein n=1 Tax=Metallosphaera sp. TaxID=2020860 RepID=UPI003167A05A